MTCFNQSFFFFFNIYLLLFLAVLVLRCCTWSFFSHGEQDPLFVVVPKLLTEVASSVSRVAGLSTCGT